MGGQLVDSSAGASGWTLVAAKALACRFLKASSGIGAANCERHFVGPRSGIQPAGALVFDVEAVGPSAARGALWPRVRR